MAYIYHCTFDSNYAQEGNALSIPGFNNYPDKMVVYNSIFTGSDNQISVTLGAKFVFGNNLIEGNDVSSRDIVFGNNTFNQNGYITPLPFALSTNRLTELIEAPPNEINISDVLVFLSTDQAGKPRPTPGNGSTVTYGSVEYVEIEPNNTQFIIRAEEHLDIPPHLTNYKIPIYIEATENISDLGIDKLVIAINKKLFFPKTTDNGSIVSKEQNLITINDILVPNLTARQEVVLLNIIGDMILSDIDSDLIEIIDVEFAENFAG